MKKNINKGDYDYLHKALGIGLYFLSKKENKSSINIEYLLIKLERNAERDLNGLKWKSFNQQENKEVYNLSLSHGIASIITFISQIYKNSIAVNNRTNKLLCEAVSFLLACKSIVPNSYNGSFFPSYVSANDGINKSGSRLAWCYGDLGIGIALWQASQVLLNKEWAKIAIDVLLQTTLRQDPNKEHVIDAGFCHGSSGIAHIYNRMYQYTGNNAFKEAAIYWINDTLSKATFSNGLAGYKAWHLPEHGGWVNESGLLEGIAGIGLVLLSTICEIEPKWDECFLLS